MIKTFINKTAIISLALSISFFVGVNANADQEDDDMPEPIDRVELTTSFIKGNKELPQVLYIVPWQEVKKNTKKPKDMVLHSLYGDIFQPITASELTGK